MGRSDAVVGTAKIEGGSSDGDESFSINVQPFNQIDVS